MKVLGIAGSLRRGSLNRSLLVALSEVAPDGVDLEIASISEIPFYNEDVQAEGFPQSVAELASKIRESDVVVIATPEYNYSFPGVLKNAIDWLSRVEDQPFNSKPIAIMGASKGALGTARSQYHLRQVFIFLNGLVMNRPEVFVGSAHNKFDDQGKLTDKDTRDFLKTYCEALLDWLKKVDG